ncbi:hypothetical protein PI125_g20437 [Phytophthora idaei]|nr:hypothetical protein PI125_g20437 [Phytophthora idaei]
MPARSAKKKIRSGRRKAPGVEVQSHEHFDENSTRVASDELPTPELPSPPKSREITSTDSETPRSRDNLPKKGVTASKKGGLWEFVASEGANTEVCPVTRSGRVSKPPSWISDYVCIAYSNTNPDEDAVCPGSVEWAKAREELQQAMAKEMTLAWWQDYCCLAMSIITESNTLDEALMGEHAMQWKSATDEDNRALMENCTWELVPREKHMKVLKNRWIFRVKYTSEVTRVGCDGIRSPYVHVHKFTD